MTPQTFIKYISKINSLKYKTLILDKNVKQGIMINPVLKK